MSEFKSSQQVTDDVLAQMEAANPTRQFYRLPHKYTGGASAYSIAGKESTSYSEPLLIRAYMLIGRVEGVSREGGSQHVPLPLRLWNALLRDCNAFPSPVSLYVFAQLDDELIWTEVRAEAPPLIVTAVQENAQNGKGDLVALLDIEGFTSCDGGQTHA